MLDEALELAVVLLKGYTGREDARRALSRALSGSEGDAARFHRGFLDRLDKALADDLSVRGHVIESAHQLLNRRDARSGQEHDWHLVLTAPTNHPTDHGIVRRTGATLRELIASARQEVRLYAPFTTATGLHILEEALVHAARHGARIELTVPDQDEPRRLLRHLSAELIDAIRLGWLIPGVPWPHLKVVLVDGEAAYVGSANLTRAGLAGGNLELGVLIRGMETQKVSRLLDSIVGHG